LVLIISVSPSAGLSGEVHQIIFILVQSYLGSPLAGQLSITTVEAGIELSSSSQIQVVVVAFVVNVLAFIEIVFAASVVVFEVVTEQIYTGIVFELFFSIVKVWNEVLVRLNDIVLVKVEIIPRKRRRRGSRRT